MIIKVSNITNIDDFIDCAIFNVDYIAIDMPTLLVKNGKKFGDCISAVPLIQNNLVLSIDKFKEKDVNKSLSICNVSILEFKEDVNIEILKMYKKNYAIWKYIENEEDVKKYAHYIDAFVVSLDQVNNLTESPLLAKHQIIVKANQFSNVEKIQNKLPKNCIIDIKYDNKISDIVRKTKIIVDN